MPDETTEEWRPIPLAGFAGYEVSDLGRVRSIGHEQRYRTGAVYTRPARIRRLHLMVSGYVSVTLRVRPKPRAMTVHRLVALAFIPNPLGLPEVNHIDRDKANNRIANLEWISHVDNIRHMTAALGGRFAPKITDDDVRNIRRMVELGLPQSAIAKSYGLDQSFISRVGSGLRRGHS